MSSKIYPIGIQNFEKIRQDGYFYIDKTALIYQMVKTGSYYFLSRPRRFGKSLLISTLEAYFRGKKELAESLVRQGFYLSFGEKYQVEALQAVPADRLLLETDESICPIEELYWLAARQRNIGVEQLVSEIQETTGLLFFNQ